MRRVSSGGQERRAAVIAALFFSFTMSPAWGAVIPQPASITLQEGSFRVGSGTAMQIPAQDRDAAAAARYLAELWNRSNRLSLLTAERNSAGEGAIVFQRVRGLEPEAYAIEVTPRRITISATSGAGLFYGAVTLWQLLPLGPSGGQIPAQRIQDAPAYGWRGLMLDSARHFQSPAFVRSMIDWMAWHKLNVLQWHLTDDQGWRLQIRKYPRLTGVGAWRIEPDGTRYGGFYSQAEVRDIVRFAATRHVRIIPEIEMPGHATAAIAAYPELGVPGAAAQGIAVSNRWGIQRHLFNLEPHTFAVLDDILGEVSALFPGTYLHVGGDEAVKDEWNDSPQVQARARQLGIHDGAALQAYFTQRIGRYLAAHGRRLVGWDEILCSGLRRDAVVMSWHGVSGAHDAALAGNDTVLAPWPVLYFDNRQSTLPSEPPGRLKQVALEDVYRFEPHDPTLDNARARHVLGVQANLWTEHMQTEQRVQWMTWPRAAALAEVAWSAPASRNWSDFLQRLAPLSIRYRAMGLQIADSVFAPAAQVERTASDFSLRLTSQAQSGGAAGANIRYTLDGQTPTAESMRVDAPLRVASDTEVTAAGFVGSDRVSEVWRKRFDAAVGRRQDSHDLELCSEGVGLLLDGGGGAPLALDIMNPCWIKRNVDLSRANTLRAGVVPLPYNYSIGADEAKIRVGDARTPVGEFEVHIDGCDSPAAATWPLQATALRDELVLAAQPLPRSAGRHDLCLRFARPRVDPLWALAWIEIGE